jgi:hypothetical protein
VNLYAIAKRVTHKETLPRRRASIIRLYTSRLQSGSQPIHVRALKTKMPLGVYSTTLLFHRNVHIQSAGIEPHAASNPKWFRFWNLPQAQMPGVKRTCYIFVALGHCDVDVGKVHVEMMSNDQNRAVPESLQTVT